MIQRSVYKFDHKCIIESLVKFIRQIKSDYSANYCSINHSVLILPLHELAHGWVAYKFGDRTAKMQED